MKEQILYLASQGFNYTEIQNKLGCSKSTISYHLGVGQKEKTKQRNKKYRSERHPYFAKLENFNSVHQKDRIDKLVCTTRQLIQSKINTFVREESMGKKRLKYVKADFTVQDVIDKFGENPKCYLTGTKINIYQPRTYSFDHIIPVSKGGPNSIDNLGICTTQANRAKHNLTPDEFLLLCQSVIDYHKSQTGA